MRSLVFIPLLSSISSLTIDYTFLNYFLLCPPPYKNPAKNFLKNPGSQDVDCGAKAPQAKIVLAEMPMVQQSPIDEQVREYLLQQERIGEARLQQAPIDEVRQDRRKWERRLGYFILAGVAVVAF